MSTHLDDAVLRRFAHGTLPADDLLRADDHLSECADCRERAAVLNDGPRVVSALRNDLFGPTGHLSDEEVQLVVAGQLAPSTRETVERHLRECITCARQVEDLRLWSAPPARPVSWPLAIAATLVLAALIPAAVRYARTTPSHANLSLPGFDVLAPAEQTQVRAALDAGVTAVPDFIEDLTGPPETLMGSSTASKKTFALVGPVGTATVSDRPRFEWQPLPGTIDYVVTVFDERSNVIQRSAALSGTSWVPADPLPRAGTYVWQVAARRARESVTVPVAPAPAAKFRVIDEHSADVLRRMEAQQPQSHVLLGILNMAAGVLDGATRHFQQVRSTDPGAGVARRSLARLEELKQRSGRQ